jgi:hypothetical protein
MGVGELSCMNTAAVNCCTSNVVARISTSALALTVRLNAPAGGSGGGGDGVGAVGGGMSGGECGGIKGGGEGGGGEGGGAE